MKLWKKNFIFVFSLLEIILFFALMLFTSLNFHQELHQEYRDFQITISNLDKYIYQMIEDEEYIFSSLSKLHRQQGLSYAITDSENVMRFSSLPIGLSIDAKNNEAVIKQDNRQYFYLTRSPEADTGTYQIIYLQDCHQLYSKFYRQIIFSLGLGLLLSGVLGWVLYWQLKKIYRPIQNLAHELRTPLTLISGYSELLLLTKQSEEQRIMMNQNILTEAQSLQKTIEELLIMGDLKNSEIKKVPLLLSEFIGKLAINYPTLVLKTKNEKLIQGNEVLINRLLVNLLDNAQRESQLIEVVITEKKLIIRNDTPKAISETVLKKLNKGRPLSPSEYTGSGQGFSIAREIAALHQASITIKAENELFVVVEVNF